VNATKIDNESRERRAGAACPGKRPRHSGAGSVPGLHWREAGGRKRWDWGNGGMGDGDSHVQYCKKAKCGKLEETRLTTGSPPAMEVGGADVRGEVGPLWHAGV